MPDKMLCAVTYTVILTVLFLKALSHETDNTQDFDRIFSAKKIDAQRVQELYANTQPDISAPDHVVRFFKHLAKHVDALWKNQNTARSLIPHLQGRGCGIGNFWSFDLTTTSLPAKDFIKCELHLFKKRTSSTTNSPLNSEIIIDFYDEDVSSCAKCGNKSNSQCRQPVTRRTVSWYSHGWQIFDISDFLNKTLLTNGYDTQISISVTLQTENENDVIIAGERTRSEDNSLRRHAHPFLVIYSNDSAVATNSLPLKRENSKLLKANPYHEEQNLRPELDSEKGGGSSSKALYRQPRSVVVRSYPLFSNRYPESESEVDETFPKFAERNYQERKAKKRARKNRKKFVKEDSEESERDDSAADSWRNTHNSFNKCSRHAMKVDFRLIGWGEYIITPKSYEAYYCAGYCPYPLTRELRPSNHAAIQSLVNTMDPYQSIPPACCVPEKMSPLSIVFFDEYQNVVLKVYPKMSVDTCACQ